MKTTRTDQAADQAAAPTEETAPAAPPVEETTPAFDPALEWPAAGGCYVRQADGTLKKEG